MKAILVVDVPDKLDYLHLYFEGRILYTTEEEIGFKFLKELSLCVLKPMPEFRDEHYKSFSIELSQIINSENRGYNDCLREILGEENET